MEQRVELHDWTWIQTNLTGGEVAVLTNLVRVLIDRRRQLIDIDLLRSVHTDRADFS